MDKKEAPFLKPEMGLSNPKRLIGGGTGYPMTSRNPCTLVLSGARAPAL